MNTETAGPVVNRLQTRDYAQWFAWALPHTGDPRRAHAAAAAATMAMLAGRDPHSAAEAGQQAAVHGPASTADPFVAGYARWYAWALNDLQLEPIRAHAAATAAQQAQLAGADPALATQAAIHAASANSSKSRRARPRGQLKRGLRLLADPAVRTVGLGTVCITGVILTAAILLHLV